MNRLENTSAVAPELLLLLATSTVTVTACIHVPRSDTMAEVQSRRKSLCLRRVVIGLVVTAFPTVLEDLSAAPSG
jgi:hypothetical protein